MGISPEFFWVTTMVIVGTVFIVRLILDHRFRQAKFNLLRDQVLADQNGLNERGLREVTFKLNDWYESIDNRRSTTGYLMRTEELELYYAIQAYRALRASPGVGVPPQLGQGGGQVDG